jgi:hypothetical protein
MPVTFFHLQPVLESLANLTTFLNCDCDELVSLPQISHFIHKFLRQFQRISLNEIITFDASSERYRLLSEMFFFKTDFPKEQFSSLVNIVKSMKRDNFLFFYLLHNEFLFYLFAFDDPSYELINSMKKWDDKKQSGCLLLHLFYRFLLDNLKKLREFSNIVPCFDIHFALFKKSLEKDRSDFQSTDVSDVEIDILL